MVLLVHSNVLLCYINIETDTHRWGGGALGRPSRVPSEAACTWPTARGRRWQRGQKHTAPSLVIKIVFFLGHKSKKTSDASKKQFSFPLKLKIKPLKFLI